MTYAILCLRCGKGWSVQGLLRGLLLKLHPWTHGCDLEDGVLKCIIADPERIGQRILDLMDEEAEQ